MPPDLETAIIVMTRAPDEGAKTRLAGLLSEAQRAALARAMLEDALETIDRARGVTPLLACHPSPDHPVLRALSERFGAERLPQGDGDLGARLARAIAAVVSRGHSRVLVIGSDSPTLPAAVLEEAVAALEAADVVLGPAFDGGYYLIGVRSSAASSALYDALFTGIPWSSSQVLAATVQRARSAGLSIALLPFWYDVDTPEDLERLSHHLRVLSAVDYDPSGRHTAAVLASLELPGAAR